MRLIFKIIVAALAVAPIASASAQLTRQQIAARKQTSQAWSPESERVLGEPTPALLKDAKSPYPDLRMCAIGEIQRRKAVQGAPILMELLVDGGPPTTQAGHWIVPGRHGHDRFREAVRMQAATALVRLGYKRAVPLLRKSLSDGSDDLRTVCAYGLSVFGDRASAPAIRRLLRYPSSLHRTGLVRDLVRLRDKRAARDIAFVLKTDTYQGTRAAAAEALGNLDAKSFGPALTAALRDRYPDVRFRAAAALAKIGYKPALPALRAALQEASPQAGNAPSMERRSHESIRKAIAALEVG